jgi:hypothetical protein
MPSDRRQYQIGNVGSGAHVVQGENISISLNSFELRSSSALGLAHDPSSIIQKLEANKTLSEDELALLQSAMRRNEVSATALSAEAFESFTRLLAEFR